MALPVINPGICKHDIHYIMIAQGSVSGQTQITLHI